LRYAASDQRPTLFARSRIVLGRAEPGDLAFAATAAAAVAVAVAIASMSPEAVRDAQTAIRGLFASSPKTPPPTASTGVSSAGSSPRSTDQHHDLRYASAAGRSTRRPKLYSATILYCGGNVMLQAYHASLAWNRRQILARLARRHGTEIASLADIRLGFHPANPIAIALLPEPVAELISDVENRANLSGYIGFAVDIAQRIQA
jgi:uncharacterized membrane protein YdfJ with MMPL/SSD domain